MTNNLPVTGRELYGKTIASVTGAMFAKAVEIGISPETVAKAVARALTANRPKRCYLVGPEAKNLALLIKILPGNMVDNLIIKMLGLPTTVKEIG